MLRLWEKLTAPLTIGVSVLFLAACGISPGPSVVTPNSVLGDDLPGAQGLTLADQDRIDVTVARGCASGAFTRAACDRHTQAAADRRRALSTPTQAPTS